MTTPEIGDLVQVVNDPELVNPDCIGWIGTVMDYDGEDYIVHFPDDPTWRNGYWTHDALIVITENEE